MTASRALFRPRTQSNSRDMDFLIVISSPIETVTLASGFEMSDHPRRSEKRDSLMLTATLRLDNDEQRVRIRNLSDGGAMVEGAENVSKGALISIHIQNIGWVAGTIVWVKERQCGIAFTTRVEAKSARLQIGNDKISRPALSTWVAGHRRV